jgi:hypothetical protein
MPEFKVTADHLKRDAYLYVRQSTLRQVAEHGESTLITPDEPVPSRPGELKYCGERGSPCLRRRGAYLDDGESEAPWYGLRECSMPSSAWAGEPC